MELITHKSDDDPIAGWWLLVAAATLSLVLEGAIAKSNAPFPNAVAQKRRISMGIIVNLWDSLALRWTRREDSLNRSFDRMLVSPGVKLFEVLGLRSLQRGSPFNNCAWLSGSRMGAVA
ncbi:MAG: hypothetical protein IPK50_04235 [Fibrobacterota bacterium]|nr:MAG: hypothetical protein IPK50_04235 [Fibrobacterota bacterium]